MNVTTITNSLNNTTFNGTNHTATTPLAQRSQRPLKALHRLLLLAALLFAGTTAWGQTNYVVLQWHLWLPLQRQWDA